MWITGFWRRNLSAFKAKGRRASNDAGCERAEKAILALDAKGQKKRFYAGHRKVVKDGNAIFSIENKKERYRRSGLACCFRGSFGTRMKSEGAGRT